MPSSTKFLDLDAGLPLACVVANTGRLDLSDKCIAVSGSMTLACLVPYSTRNTNMVTEDQAANLPRLGCCVVYFVLFTLFV